MNPETILPCNECGMPVKTGEYHPYAACLMFKACKDSKVVSDNLAAVQWHGFSTMRRPQADWSAAAREIFIADLEGPLTEERIVAIIRKYSGQREGWVKCSERMPPQGHVVLAYWPAIPESADANGLVEWIGRATWMGPVMKWASHEYDGPQQPTHWMPLPAAPDKGRL